jgi:ATP-binding protein involved in chromosome partitioning
MNPAVQPSRTAVLAVLDRVADPKSGKGLAAAGLVQGLSLGEGRVGFMLEVPAAEAALYAPVREAAEKALLSIGGVQKAQVVLTTASAAPAPGVTRVRRGASSPWPAARAASASRRWRPTSPARSRAWA